MGQFNEYPPILQGSEKQQIAALRAYLVRLAEGLMLAETAPAAEAAAAEDSRRVYAGRQSELEKLRETAQSLRSLIIKTADKAEYYTDSRIEALHGEYLAQSDFGVYSEQISSRMEATAKQVVESYGLEAVSESIDGLSRYMSELRGQIQRGLITDPETGETVFGIAISESLRFTGESEERGGETYYELSPGQTLGLYTSSGWQFWINGAKKGWFDSTDGMLHVANVAVENSLLIGDDWLVTSQGGYGIRYLGGV